MGGFDPDPDRVRLLADDVVGRLALLVPLGADGLPSAVSATASASKDAAPAIAVTTLTVKLRLTRTSI